eukprot:286799-Rhodomonas_salina.3
MGTGSVGSVGGVIPAPGVIEVDDGDERPLHGFHELDHALGHNLRSIGVPASAFEAHAQIARSLHTHGRRIHRIAGHDARERGESTGVFDTEAASASGPVTAERYDPTTTSRSSELQSSVCPMHTEGADSLSRKSTLSLKPSGRSAAASGTSELFRVATWCTAIAAAAASRVHESPSGSPASPFRRTNSPMPAVYARHSPSTTSLRGGHCSHRKVLDENTAPVSQLTTLIGTVHVRSPPSQTGGCCPCCCSPSASVQVQDTSEASVGVPSPCTAS